jgi:hypothetical protein
MKKSGDPHHDVSPDHPATIFLLHDHVTVCTAKSTAAIAFIEECLRPIRIESDPLPRHDTSSARKSFVVLGPVAAMFAENRF